MNTSLAEHKSVIRFTLGFPFHLTQLARKCSPLLLLPSKLDLNRKIEPLGKPQTNDPSFVGLNALNRKSKFANWLETRFSNFSFTDVSFAHPLQGGQITSQ